MKSRIFIVEDEPIIAKDLKSFLEDEGYTVVGFAMDSESALNKIHTQEIDLVLLDIMIEGSKSGIEVAAVIREKYDLPFIFLSSLSDDITLKKAVETSPYGYIVKPFNEKSLKTTIATALHKHKMEKELVIKSNVDSMADVPLSTKEFQILEDLVKGLTNDQIAERHFISTNTVKYHLKNIFAKLNVSSRSAAISKVIQN